MGLSFMNFDNAEVLRRNRGTRKINQTRGFHERVQSSHLNLVSGTQK